MNLKSYELQRLSKIFGEEFRQQVLKDILKTTKNFDIVSYESFSSICQQALTPEHLRNKFLKMPNEEKKADNTIV